MRKRRHDQVDAAVTSEGQVPPLLKGDGDTVPRKRRTHKPSLKNATIQCWQCEERFPRNFAPRKVGQYVSYVDPYKNVKDHWMEVHEGESRKEHRKIANQPDHWVRMMDALRFALFGIEPKN